MRVADLGSVMGIQAGPKQELRVNGWQVGRRREVILGTQWKFFPPQKIQQHKEILKTVCPNDLVTSG